MDASLATGYNSAVLRTSVLSGTSCFEDLKGPWQSLVPDSASATPFQTWEWQSTWWRYFGRSRSPHLFAVYEGRDLVGLMPLAKSSGPWRALRAVGNGSSDYLHPLARTGYEELVAERLSEHLDSLSGIDLIDLHQVRETQPLAAKLGGRSIEQARCLVLDLPGSYEEYLGRLGKSLRYDVRKLDKSLFTTGKASLSQIGPDEVRQGMEWLFESHKKRWRKRGLPGAFLGKALTFHHDWAKQAAERGFLWLSVLKVEGESIGAIYAMALNDGCYYYQAGFDPAKGSISPGTLLVAHTIRRAIEEGKRTFDFLRGDEGYKRRWKPQRELRNLRLLSPASGVLGKIGIAWNDAGSRVESKVRARLEGKSLI